MNYLHPPQSKQEKSNANKKVVHTFSLLVVENKGLVGDLTSSSIVDQFLAFLVVIVQPPMDEIGQ